MARKFTARTIDGSKSVDLLASPYSVRGDIKIGAPTRTDIGKQKKRNGMLLTDQDWTDRNITWHQQIRGNDLDDLRANYRGLLDIITQEQWELVHNSGGATEQDRYYDCYAFLEVPVINNKALRLLMFPLDMAVEAKPFARGDAVDLPRNWVKDALLMESFAPPTGSNFIPNSFTIATSATPPTYTVKATDPSTGQPLGYTEIEVTAGAADRYIEIQQTLANASASHSGRIEIQVPTAPTQANYSVIFDGSSNDITLLNIATSAEVNWTEKKAEGQALSASAVMKARVYCTGSSPSCKIRVRNAMLVQAATLRKGRDGGTLFYCSQVGESPATMIIDNVPGDLEAPALATLQFVNTTARDYALSSAGEKLYVGMGTGIDRPTLVKSYYGGGADSECIGGNYGSGGYGPSAIMKMGRVFVFTRGFTNSPTATTDTGYHKQFADWSWNNYAAYKSPVIRPFVNIGQSKWGVIPWGQFEFPILDDPDFDSIQNGIAPTGGGTYNDYHAFMPVEQNFRAEVSFDSGKYLKVVSDSISRNPGFFWERMASAGIEYPFSGASAIAIPGQKVFGEPFTLPTGKPIKILALGTRYSEETYYRDKKTGVLMGIKYVPRFVE